MMLANALNIVTAVMISVAMTRIPFSGFVASSFSCTNYYPVHGTCILLSDLLSLETYVFIHLKY